MGNTDVKHAPMIDDAEERYRVEGVARAARLLDALARGPADVGALARETRLSVDFARRTLATLERVGLASLDDDGETWRLGLAWVRLADTKRRRTDLRAIALPIMRRMRDATDETVSLSVPRGRKRVVIESVESRQSVRRVAHTGFETALHSGASGRALLLGLSHDERDIYFAELCQETPGFDQKRYGEDLRAARAAGYARSAHEVTQDMSALAAPVRDHAGEIVAALTISTPSERLTPERERENARALTSGAHELSRLLGHPADEAAQDRR